jgi:hypothetical protein
VWTLRRWGARAASEELTMLGVVLQYHFDSNNNLEDSTTSIIFSTLDSYIFFLYISTP